MSILICLTILLAWTSQCASLSLTPSTKILSRFGTSNFTLNCTIDDHPNSTTSDGGLEEVHQMRIVKRGKDRWNTVVEMSPEWMDPKVADDFQGKLTAESGQTYLLATWPMASNDIIGQYMCDLFGYLGNGEGIWQRTPSVYIDAEAPLDLFELFKMTKKALSNTNENNKRIQKIISTQEMFQEKLETSDRTNKKVERDIIKNEQLIEEINSTHESVQKNLNNTNTTLKSLLQDVSMLKLEVSNNTNEKDIAENRELIEKMSSTQEMFQRKVETSYKANRNVLNDVTKNKEIIEKMNYTQEMFQKNMDNINITLVSMLQEMLKFKISNNTTRKALKDISTNKELIKKMNISQENIRHEVDHLIELVHVWPQGTYALIEPETGCPVDSGVEWKTGYRKHHTESTNRNHDHVSTPAHMKKPVMQTENGQNFVTQHHCSVIDPSPGRAWPAGSYCVMRYRNMTCPVGFKEGSIIYDEEDTNFSPFASGYYAHSRAVKSFSHLHFCCRSDSLPNEPIHLPTTKPFYLHRYGGICQQVKMMTVTEEFIHFDTEDDNPKSAFRGYAPDDATSPPDVKLQLCYYEPI